MDRHNNGRTASPESGLERREQMQKSVKKSNKKTGAAGKYTAPGAFVGAQPSNLVELIEAQRGKAASSAGKKPAADTALANKCSDLQLQSFGQFGADPAAIVGQQAGQTVGGWLHSSAAKPKDTALANEWANLQLQSFGQFGADPAAIAGQQAGQTAGDWLENQLAQTGFNEDESKLAYLGEKFTNGAHRAVEGAYNNAIDNSRAQVDAQLRNGFVTDTGVNQRDIQNALASIFGGKYAQHAQDTQAADLAVAAELSGAADGLRSTRAAEYGRDIDERYGATGLWKLGGDVAAGAGQMAPTVAVNLLTGGRLGTPFLLSSAAGNAAAEARAGGADEETAFLYGILSGGVEAATERISAGIPGLNKTGLLDDVLSRVASSPTGRGAVKKLVDVLGEGAEEYISEIAGAYLARLWNGDERGAWQTFVETQPDALYAGLVGTLTSAVMNLPGEAYTLARKNKTGAVPGAQQSGNSVPRLFTRDEVQGMSAREVSENYDAIRESMEMWDENGELQGGTQSRMVDRQAPGEDNETTSGNERLYTRAEVQGMSEEEQLANVDAIRESMGLWDAEGKLSKESEITIEEVRDDFEQIKHIKNLENFVEDPLLLKDVSPETLYCFLEKQGYTILPLAQSKTLTGIHYKDGGGFKVNWGGDRILQYHPATGSHHNGAYYKISSGKTGKVRIDLHGNKI